MQAGQRMDLPAPAIEEAKKKTIRSAFLQCSRLQNSRKSNGRR